MPHFLAQSTVFQTYPFCDQGYEFLYEAFSLKHSLESLICVAYKGNKFFIHKIKRQNDILFKAQKITRPNPIGILKGGLRVLSKRASVLSHNLNNDTIRQGIESPFLLKPHQILELELSEFCIEIGFGSGRHLLNKAQANPEKIYIGVEIHTPSIQQVLRQIELLKLQNLYVVCTDARILLEILPSNKCEVIYVHFPIPWNKKPHRRVMGRKFIDQALRVLKQNGVLELRTDDEEYFRDTLQIALDSKNAKIEVAKNLSNEVISKYEARWQRQHKDIFDLRIFSLIYQEEKRTCYDFAFDFFCLQNLKAISQIQKILKQDYFLHICDIFKSEYLTILSVSFGDFSWPVNKMIVFDEKNQEAYYFGGQPLATKANIAAHEMLLSLLRKDYE